MVFRYLDKFQFVEQNSVECPCDLGANLVQHFMRRYSRYSRYRTKSHDKATISHDITRYSRYRTAFLKLQEIISTKGRNLQKMLCLCRAFFVISWRTVMIALWASYQFRLATPSYERLRRVGGMRAIIS